MIYLELSEEEIYCLMDSVQSTRKVIEHQLSHSKGQNDPEALKRKLESFKNLEERICALRQTFDESAVA